MYILIQISEGAQFFPLVVGPEPNAHGTDWLCSARTGEGLVSGCVPEVAENNNGQRREWLPIVGASEPPPPQPRAGATTTGRSPRAKMQEDAPQEGGILTR